MIPNETAHPVSITPTCLACQRCDLAVALYCVGCYRAATVDLQRQVRTQAAAIATKDARIARLEAELSATRPPDPLRLVERRTAYRVEAQS